jgi:hypothetical protein
MGSEETIIAEDAYIEQRMTAWDKFRAWFLFTPVIVLVTMIMAGLFFYVPESTQRIGVGVFVILMVIAIIFRMMLSAKIAYLKKEYQAFKESVK